MRTPVDRKKLFKEPVLFLAGPTGIGKTELALGVAEECNCEIVGVDSMQIYKYMDIGTAKPTTAERGRVVHHLIDYVAPDQDYNAAVFVEDCIDAITEIRRNGKIPLLAGGTGLYFKALEYGIFDMPEVGSHIRAELHAELKVCGSKTMHLLLQKVDPESAERLHPNDSHRIIRALEIFRATGATWTEMIHQQQHNAGSGDQFPQIFKVGLERDRDELYDRINRRVELMVEQGLLVEVEGLLKMGYHEGLKSMQSLGYRHMINFINDRWDWQKSIELLARDTRRYAKRQLTWFKHAGKGFEWFHPGEQTQIFAAISRFLAQWS